MGLPVTSRLVFGVESCRSRTPRARFISVYACRASWLSCKLWRLTCAMLQAERDLTPVRCICLLFATGVGTGVLVRINGRKSERQNKTICTEDGACNPFCVSFHRGIATLCLTCGLGSVLGIVALGLHLVRYVHVHTLHRCAEGQRAKKNMQSMQLQSYVDYISALFHFSRLSLLPSPGLSTILQ